MSNEQKKGHPHAKVAQQYWKEAETDDKAYLNWEIRWHTYDDWEQLVSTPLFVENIKYRRKPKTFMVNGVELPDLRVKEYVNKVIIAGYSICKGDVLIHYNCVTDKNTISKAIEIGIAYHFNEEGEKAAGDHTRAMLGVHPKQLNKGNE